MTLPHIPDPLPGDAAAADAIETVIVPRARDLGGFEVRRALPSAQRQMVGPFIFFDQFGPVVMQAGKGIDVRPHPHIGLATVTWLMDGSIYHRDSLGSEQPITPGEVSVAGQVFEAGRLLVFRPGDAITVRARSNARLMLLGGEPMDGPRYVWWNFVSSSKERIEAAKDDWKQARFAIVPGDEEEFIPLPES